MASSTTICDVDAPALVVGRAPPARGGATLE
jgi:hypothetical protein